MMNPVIGDLEPGDMLLWDGEQVVQLVLSVKETVLFDGLTGSLPKPVRDIELITVDAVGRVKFTSWRQKSLGIGAPATRLSVKW